jgi:hypothetical protein
MDTKQIQMMAAEIYRVQSDGQDFAGRLARIMQRFDGYGALGAALV